MSEVTVAHAGTSRVEAFSDGVLAIAITLLVLELRAPVTGGEFAHELRAEWPTYLAYLSAFVMIGVIWLHHHELLRRMTGVDTPFVLRNLALLLTGSLLPFPTAVVSSAFRNGERADQVVALGLFGALSICISLAWMWLCSYAAKHSRLMVDADAVAFAAGEPRRGVVPGVMTVVAFLIAFVAPPVTLVLYAATPIYYLATLGRGTQED